METKKIISPLSLILITMASFLFFLESAVAARPNGTETKPVFYPSAPEKPRIQFLSTINGSNFINSNNSAYGDRFPGYTGTDAIQEANPLIKPYGIAAAKGQIFVCDSDRKQVMIFDLAHGKVDALQGLKRPINLAVDSDGTRYVVDAELKKIMIYGANNQYVKSFGDPATMKPISITISGDQLFYTDMAANQVVILNKSNGKELGRIGTPGSTLGKLSAPTSLTLDAQKNIYIADTFNARISKFENNGKFLDTLGEMGIKFGNFVRPKGLAVDREGRIYVIDGSFENIQIFNADKQLLLFFGDVGNVRGGVNMPAQIVIDYDNVEYFKKYVAKDHEIEYLIYVSNTFGENKVNVYGFLKN
ncbi:MAG: hypothetical protein A2X86_21380 [Bdellovibrionales bacterium GWA2_49_15]|nr:MAG: hypothetical protein A2X86_21380 [Bdellovibrionales bacterium GWA2_49_15]HAZ14932.1 hypothetical protein [Bdellovibrionales bacterium]